MIRFEDGIEGSETWTLKDLRVERMGVKCDAQFNCVINGVMIVNG